MNIQDRVLGILNSDARETFLLALGHRMGIFTREALDEDAAHGTQQARACNEMTIAIWSQVWATRDAKVEGYPDSEFLPVLLEKADRGNARRYLRHSLESSMLMLETDGAIEPDATSP
ncbi:hypothetical protein OEIGOIKO_07035 [Streptomyces chrestomyceticus JCM 4735]|uniref:Uncharacterized protein n=1 Tax=Streptomyces chrestomyceticus JCM 4735 TaxID=1306181 RepID=A0A7U9L196_9ACTN|nr:hypothetical protein [Streptomyces chrestomyceticus]GCD39206.1 hypothetical protein OEIGOIKO_07035 [Streptomyces chrestomyceticus JCM 4735]